MGIAATLPLARIARAELPASREVPFTVMVDPHTLRTTEGDLVRVFRLEGFAHESADDEDLMVRHRQFNLLLRNVASEHVALWSHIVRRQVHGYPAGEFAPGFAHDLNERYRASLAGSRLYVNELYVSLVWRAEPSRTRRFMSRLSVTRDIDAAIASAAAAERLRDVSASIERGLEKYGARLLGTYEHAGVRFSEPLEFLASLVNGYWQRMPAYPRASLRDLLVTARPLVGREVAELRGPESSVLVAALGLKEYPAQTVPGILNGLLSLPFELTVSQSFAFMDKQRSAAMLTRYRDRMENADDPAVSQIEGIEQAQDDLASNEFAFGEHHVDVLVRAADPAALLANVAAARTALADTGAVVARHDLGLEAALWAQLPGNFQYRPRPTSVTSRNFAGFSAFHNFPAGRAAGNHWGPAIARLKTTAGGAYDLSLHVRDVGHTFVCGPTGSGKTVLQGFVTAMLEKFGARGVFIDKDRGAELLIRAQGGAYFALRDGEPTGWNPFHLEPDAANVLFVQALVRRLVTAQGGALSTRQERDLTDAVERVFGLSRPLRRLGSMLDFLDETDVDGVAARLRRWVWKDGVAGPLAWLFDNPRDELDFGTRLTGFDMTQFLENAFTRTPTMMYLFHRVRQQLDGQRFYFFIDEVQRALADADFQREVKDAHETFRKLNAFIVTATQSPHNALASGIGHTIVGQTATTIWLPNPKADRADYVDGFKLTEQEFGIVRSLGEASHQFLVKQGAQSVVAELDLDGFADELAILSGTAANVELLDRIRARVGDDPAAWLSVFHAERRGS